MLLTIILLSISTIMLYVGYSYKAFFLFIFGMLLEDSSFVIKRFLSAKTILDNDFHKLKFYINNKQYILMIEQNKIELNRHKILALSDTSNVTEYVMQFMGPLENFFGSKIKPEDIGLNNLTIWKNKYKYSFDKSDVIEFTQEARDRKLISENDSSEDTEEE